MESVYVLLGIPEMLQASAILPVGPLRKELLVHVDALTAIIRESEDHVWPSPAQLDMSGTLREDNADQCVQEQVKSRWMEYVSVCQDTQEN